MLAALLKSGKLDPSAEDNQMISTALQVGDIVTAETLLAMPGYEFLPGSLELSSDSHLHLSCDVSLRDYHLLSTAVELGLTSFVKLICAHPSFNPRDPRANMISATMNPPRPEL